MEDISKEVDQKLTEQKLKVEKYKGNKTRVTNLLEQYRGEIGRALPKLLTPDRMIRTALTAMGRNPELMECTSHSLISCVLTSAQLGLMPDNVLGEAYLIPFNNNKKQVKECQFIVGYKGLLTLAMRSGQVKSISAFAVFAANQEGGDKFDYDQGLNEKLEHKPSGLTDQARITHFYCIVRFVNGGHAFRVMTRSQVEAVRNESANYKYSKYKNDTVWGKYFEEMGCKTVIRRLMKYVPLSPELSKAIALDEAADAGTQNTSLEFLDTTPEFTEDVTHEIINENEADEQEHQDEVKQKATTTGKELNGKTEQAIKDQQNKANANKRGKAEDKSGEGSTTTPPPEG